MPCRRHQRQGLFGHPRARRWTNIPLLFLMALPLRAQAGAPVRLYPIDETARDSSFRSYVSKLRAAVSAEDVKALRKLVDEDVVVGPGKDDKGWAKFVARWRPGDSGEGTVWSALSTLLGLGFVREHPSLYLSPYLVWRFPRELNPATHLVVVRDKAPLRSGPSVRAPATALLSFDVVRRLAPPVTGEDASEWHEVQTLDGKSGYLNARDCMSPTMPRAQFAQERGRWRLTGLESGE